MAQEGSIQSCQRGKMLQDRGVLPKEEGDVVSEKAMHEEFPKQLAEGGGR